MGTPPKVATPISLTFKDAFGVEHPIRYDKDGRPYYLGEPTTISFGGEEIGPPSGIQNPMDYVERSVLDDGPGAGGSGRSGMIGGGDFGGGGGYMSMPTNPDAGGFGGGYSGESVGTTYRAEVASARGGPSGIVTLPPQQVYLDTPELSSQAKEQHVALHASQITPAAYAAAKAWQEAPAQEAARPSVQPIVAMAEPLVEAAPVQQAAQSFQTQEPELVAVNTDESFQSPSVSYANPVSQSEPVLAQPAQVELYNSPVVIGYQNDQPVFLQPEIMPVAPAADQAEQVFESPVATAEPVYQAFEPIVEQVYQFPSTAEPIYQSPEIVAEPVSYESPEIASEPVNYETPEIVSEAVNYESPGIVAEPVYDESYGGSGEDASVYYETPAAEVSDAASYFEPVYVAEPVPAEAEIAAEPEPEVEHGHRLPAWKQAIINPEG
jgi:hypothetical protein